MFGVFFNVNVFNKWQKEAMQFTNKRKGTVIALKHHEFKKNCTTMM